jgi:hypothetical protein
MATFKAINVGLLFALVEEGFEPAGDGRVTHPTLTGREAKRAFQRAWEKAIEVAKQFDANAGVVRPKCVGGDPQCNCLGFHMEPFGRLTNANLNV